MTQQEITEGNKLIAEFMGMKYNSHSGQCTEGFMKGKYGKWFLTSWDWLMPVVVKIEKDHCHNFETIIYSASCHIRSITGTPSFMGTGKKIEAIWQAVLEFIKYHNSLSTQSSTLNTQK